METVKIVFSIKYIVLRFWIVVKKRDSSTTNSAGFNAVNFRREAKISVIPAQAGISFRLRDS